MNAPKSSLSLRRRLTAESGSLLLLIIFFLAFFHRGIIGKEFYIFNDPYSYLYPLRTIAWQMIAQGQLPLWVPQIFSGYPLLSMSHLGLPYPLTWLYLVLPGYVVEQILVLIPNLLSSVFTYWYLRELERSQLAALLGGLTFGYGGMMASSISNGMMSNAVMWLPLILIGLHRTQSRSLSACLWRTVAAYTLSVLTGVAQGFLFTGIVVLAYGLFLSLSGHSLPQSQPDNRRWDLWLRWKPLVISVLTIVCAAGLASFQLFESWQAKTLSIRHELTYELFSELSYPPGMLIQSLILPLYRFLETSPFVLPLSLILMLFAGLQMIRRPREHLLLCFWMIAGVTALLLMAGPATPLHRLLYAVPILRDFRGPSRHSFEWTFAVSILAAFGWDYMGSLIAQRRVSYLSRILVVLALAVGILCGVLWLRAIPLPDNSQFFASQPQYLFWKIIFVLTTSAGLWMGWRMAAAPERRLLLTGLLLLTCFVEPYILARRWWIWAGIPPQRFGLISSATKFLQQQPHAQNVPERVYTRADLFSEQFSLTPRLDCINNTAMHGLYDVAGYEPLILRRYSQALGNVWLDGVRARGEAVLPSLWHEKSQVLDLLNTRYVTAFEQMQRNAPVKTDVLAFTSELSPEASQANPVHLTVSEARGDTIGFVSTLANSVQIEDGTSVARVLIYTTDGRIIERMMRAGTDTSEWAYDRADVRAVIRHRRAQIFLSNPGDAQGSFSAHQYQTAIPLGESVSIERVEIHPLHPQITLALWRAAIFDSETRISLPLMASSQLEYLNFPARWESAYTEHNVLILRNRRALPRAWLTGSVMAVSETEALQYIRGQHSQPWNPRETALLEVSSAQLPPLSGQKLKDDASVEFIRHQNNRLELQSTASQSAMLVVSEINYPGWKALVDGKPAQIYQTNYLLRGVFLPPGHHRIEMSYTAPAAQRGLMVSLLTLVSLAVLLTIAHRRTRPAASQGGEFSVPVI
jgi:hypothetical protein